MEQTIRSRPLQYFIVKANMPIYSYQCPQCGYKFDQRLPYSASGSIVVCPKCSAEAKKVYSSPFVIYGQGYFKPMDWGKHDVTVNYPDGRNVDKDWNTMYEDGGL